MIKIIAALALLSALTLVSCSDSSSADESTDSDESEVLTAETAAETEETDEETIIPDNLPDTRLDGYKFRIFVSTDEMLSFFYSDEYTGEVVNDSIRNAILNTENRFDCAITPNVQGSSDEGNYSNTVKAAIKAGDDLFDAAEVHDSLGGSMSLENLFINLHTVEHLDFEQPWYPANANDSLTIDGKLFLYSSAMSYKGLHQTRILYVNKTLLNNYDLSSPYDDVFAGNWTLDRLSSLTSNIYSDLNANGEKDENDLYGFTVHKYFDGWMESFNIHAIEPDVDEVLKLAINGDRTYTAVEKMYDWIFSGNDAYVCLAKDGDTKSESDIFSEERSLITYGEISSSYLVYRLTDVDYGMLPFPKLDETQENYISFYTDRFFVIPTTAQNTDTIGLLLEAMSAEGYREVFPAYYEIALKGKYAQDSESVKILDIINSSRTMSVSYVYFNGSPYTSVLANMFPYSKPSSDFASFYQKILKSAEKSLDKLISTFESLG